MEVVVWEYRGLKAYNAKVIETPSTKEVWIYDEPVIYRTKRKEAEPDESKQSGTSARKQAESLRRKQKHYEQMRWVIARLIDCNFDDKTKFITLTFKRNITDIEQANTEFKNFVKRLNYHVYDQKKRTTKYIATWEKQKRGAIHYHVVFFGFPYVKKQELERIWGHGFVSINRIDVDSKENRGRYLSKYFAKDLELKEHKKKAFFTSRNLKKPLVSRLVLDDEAIKAFTKENILFSKEYQRKTYISEVMRRANDDTIFHDTRVRYLKIRK